MRKPWTQDDLAYLTEHYPALGPGPCAEVLGRTYSAIISKVRKLEVKAHRGMVWTPKQESHIREMWSNNIGIVHIAAEMGVNPRTIDLYTQKHLPRRDLNTVLTVARRKRAWKFSRAERAHIVHEYTMGMKTRKEVAALIGCSGNLLLRILREEGVDTKKWKGLKVSEKAKEDYASGKRVVPVKSSYGIATPGPTPFQGTKTFRSSTEGVRALELDSFGVAWFYEIQRYRLRDRRSYLPDFWITDVPLAEAGRVLGTAPTKEEIRAWLRVTPHKVEDVKGWFDERHRSYEKIRMFREDHPKVAFSVYVMGRQRKRLYG